MENAILSKSLPSSAHFVLLHFKRSHKVSCSLSRKFENCLTNFINKMSPWTREKVSYCVSRRIKMLKIHLILASQKVLRFLSRCRGTNPYFFSGRGKFRQIKCSRENSFQERNCLWLGRTCQKEFGINFSHFRKGFQEIPIRKEESFLFRKFLESRKKK